MGQQSRIDHRDEVKGRMYDRRLLYRLLQFAKPYKWYVALSVLLLLTASAIELLWPQLIRLAIDDYITPVNLDDSERVVGIQRLGLLYLATLFIRVIFEYGQIMLMNFTGQKSMHDLRMKLFTHVQALGMHFFTRQPVGRLVTRMTNDVNQLNELFSSGIVGIIGDLIILLGIVGMMLWMHWKLALLSFTVLPLIVLAVILFRWKIRPVYLSIRKHLAQLNTFMQEQISGMLVVQLFNHQSLSHEAFDTLNRRYRDSQMQMIRIHGVFMPAIEALSSLALAVLLYGGALFIYHGTMQVGVLIAFLLYVRRFYRPIRDLSQKYNVVQNSLTASARVFDLMDESTTDISPLQDYQTLQEKTFISRKFPMYGKSSIRGEIEYRSLSFAYLPDEYVLRDINLHITAGENVAIVGVTGAGKTTMVNLLVRFYDYQEGCITLDGVELKEFDHAVIRRNIAYVHQDFFLFAGTVRDNISLWDAQYSDAQIEEAAKASQVHDFISSLPKAYNEPILEGGTNLSTGQKQLICFARALVRKPRIVILDEATSNIDSETEHQLQKALESLFQNRTSIVIAHRLSTVLHADRIVVMNEGKIVDIGSHEELMAKGSPHYEALYRYQFQV